MTRALEDMQPDEVLREYFAERRRRESPPSLAGIEPDQPRERKPDSGRYESLILLTRGCDRIMLECMYAASALYQLAGWQCPESGCEQVVLHEHRPALGEDGRPIGDLTTVVTVAVHPSAVSTSFGIPLVDVKRRIAGVLSVVSENAAQRRGVEREDPATAWRSCLIGGVQ